MRAERLGPTVAIITGAGGGIGRSIALALAGDGMAVSLWGRSEASLEETAELIRAAGGTALALVADVADEDAVAVATARTVSELGRIDVLVNNAALNHPPTAVLDLDPDVWRQVVDVNLTGTFLCVRHVVPHMVEAGSGRVISISSIGGRKGGKGRAAYRATKAALINLTETLASEVHASGVTVNCVCPGGTDTPMARVIGLTQAPEELSHPDDIAEVVRFLASDRSRAITGTSIDAFGPANPLFR